MEKYISIDITYFDNEPVRMTKSYMIGDESVKLLHFKSYTQAMQELRRMERRLHKVAKLDVNSYDHTICSKTLYFFLA